MAAKKKTRLVKLAPTAPVARKIVPKKLTPVLRSIEAPPAIALTSAVPLPIPHDQIALRAYDICESKLRIAQDALRNWTEAEAAIRAELRRG